MHKAEQILNAIYDSCQQLVADDVVLTVEKNTARPPFNFPALVIRVGQDAVSSRDSHFITTEQAINVNIIVKNSPNSLDTETLNIREALHKRITSTPALGLDYVMEVVPQGQDEPEYVGDSDEYSMVTNIPWLVRYRYPINNPSV